MPLPTRAIRTIALFRALQLGDMMCAIPAVRALRKAYPQARITLIGLPWARSFASRFNGYFSDFLCFPGFPGLPEQGFDFEAFAAYLTHVNRQRYDLVIQMHGNGTLTNSLVATFGAARVAGFRTEHAYCPDDRYFLPYPDDVHEIERHLKLMEFLGVARQGQHLEFPIAQSELAEYHRTANRYGLKPSRYVCLHPGGRSLARRWRAEGFAEVGDFLAEKGYRIVVTGTDSERPVAEEVISEMRHPAVNLTGKTSLGALATLLGNSRLLFSNDTGVSHMAAAVGAPSVVVFTASDPVRWAPLNALLHRTVMPRQASDSSIVLSRVEQALQEKDVRQVL